MSLPSHQNDEQALDAFVQKGCDRAFALLVSRYADMVFGTARRKGGSAELAEEVTQNVFALLARKAGSLRSANVLGVWLHRATIMETRNLLRRELNHRRKMERYSKALAAEPADPLWTPAEPHLDDAIDHLHEADRRMIVLRFFEGLSFKEIGTKLGKSEVACQKRTRRAVEKLGHQLRRVGVALPAAAIASGLAAHVAEAAPAGLTATLAKGALANAAPVTTSTSNLVQIMTYTNWKIAAIAVVAAAIPLTLQWTQNRSLASRVDTLQSEIDDPANSDATHRATGPRKAMPLAEPNRKDASDVWHSIRQLRKFLAQSEAAPHRRATLAMLVAHIRTLPAEAMDEAYGILSASPFFASQSPQSTALVFAFFSRWGTTDPETATESAFARGFERESAIGAVFNGWVRVDPDAALAAFGEARSRLSQSSWESRMEDTIRALALHDPEAAASKVLDLDVSTHQKYSLTGAVGGYWADADFNAALEWVESLPEGEPRTRAFTSAVRQLADDDPRSAAELTHTMPPGSEKVRLFVSVQEKWWAADPEGSMAWYRARGLRERPPSPAEQPTAVQTFPIEKE